MISDEPPVFRGDDAERAGAGGAGFTESAGGLDRRASVVSIGGAVGTTEGAVRVGVGGGGAFLRMKGN